MTTRSRSIFLALIVTQAAHSVEEYIFRLYDVFGPARFISGLVSDRLDVGFLIANAGFILFGLWCYVARVRPGHPSARGFAWLWAVVELSNGIVHPFMAVTTGGYFPGVVTALALFGFSVALLRELLRAEPHRQTA